MFTSLMHKIIIAVQWIQILFSCTPSYVTSPECTTNLVYAFDFHKFMLWSEFCINLKAKMKNVKAFFEQTFYRLIKLYALMHLPYPPCK